MQKVLFQERKVSPYSPELKVSSFHYISLYIWPCDFCRHNNTQRPRSECCRHSLVTNCSEMQSGDALIPPMYHNTRQKEKNKCGSGDPISFVATPGFSLSSTKPKITEPRLTTNRLLTCLRRKLRSYHWWALTWVPCTISRHFLWSMFWRD